MILMKDLFLKKYLKIKKYPRMKKTKQTATNIQSAKGKGHKRLWKLVAYMTSSSVDQVNQQNKQKPLNPTGFYEYDCKNLHV